MHPAVEMREQVAAWLAAHPQIVAPPGWKSRDPGTASTQEVLDSLASEIEQLALGRAAAASAAEAGNDAAGEQVRQLCARSVRLSGRMPGGRRCEYLGVYDRLEAEDLLGNELLLYAGRCAYVLRGTLVGPRQPMLWHAVNGFWHAGERQYLGLQTGWLIVADEAAAPEHIVSEWKLWHDGRLWLAPRVRCIVAREDDEDPGEYVAASGEGPDETRRLEEERLQEEAEYGLEEVEEDEGEEDEYEEDEGDDGVHGRQAAEEVHRLWADDEALLARAAATVRMTLGARLDLVLLLLPEGMMLGVFVGEYTRCDEHELGGRVHGRYTYVKKGAPHVRMWWTSGFWHLGYSAHLGQQLAAVIAQSDELLPEDVKGPWKVFLPQHDGPGADDVITMEQLEAWKRGVRTLAKGIKYEDFYPPFVVSYASGRRPGDCEGSGPGVVYVKGLMEFLHGRGVQCFSGLQVPAGVDWETFMLRLTGMNGKREKPKVLIVILTAALYRSKPCLKEISTAIKNKITLLPVRFEDKLPAKEDQWTDLEDEEWEMMKFRVQEKLNSLNNIPNPGTDLKKMAAEAADRRLKGLTDEAERGARDIHVADHMPIKRFFYAAKTILQQARTLAGEQDLERAYVLLIRFSFLVVEVLPTHAGFKTAEVADDRKALINEVSKVLEEVALVKNMLRSRYLVDDEARIRAEMDCQLDTTDPDLYNFISRRHARIRLQNNEFILDNFSVNQTKVGERNLRESKSAVLTEGALVIFGSRGSKREFAYI
eukprot:jgi/Chrpa1/2840/Chrysochromulina_OHIO_Genome00011605-RA